MRFSPRSDARCFVLFFLAIFIQLSASRAHASAYNAHPKLIVVIIIDQFRGDYLERYCNEFITSSTALTTNY